MSKPLRKKFSSRIFAAMRGAFDRRGYRLDRFDQMNFFEPLLYRRLARSSDFFFVQIGANDGISSDPIRDFVTRNQVAGIVVEPLKDIFEKLCANYRGYPKVKPVNVAVHATEKTIQIHRVDPAKAAALGNWAHGIASVRQEHHALTQTPPELMTTETVPCVTFDELLAQNGVRNFDLLQIDTEGYDREILRMMDFNRHKPAIIRFEHGMPDGIMTAQDFVECTELLMKHGYYVVTEPYDAIAYNPALI
jgi:FkbM family methyltransferase